MPDYIKKLFFHHLTQALIFFTIATIILLSLVTYNASDPSFNLSTNKHPGNFLGYGGAYLADLLYQFFGITAYFFVACFFSWAAILGRKKELTWLPLKIFALLFSSLASSVLLVNFQSKTLPAGISGSIGTLLFPLIKPLGMTGYVSLAVSAIIFLSIALGLGYGFCFTFLARLRAIKFKIPATAAINIKVKPGVVPLSPKASGRKAPVLSYNELSIEPDTLTKNPIVPASTASSGKAPVTFSNQLPSDSQYSLQGNNVDYIPPIDLLAKSTNQNIKLESPSALKQNAENLLSVLNDFGVKGQIIDISQGPVVTLYEFEPMAGTKSSRVIGLAEDIARSLSAISTRIATIPGRNVLGIELPNKQREFFTLRELIETAEYQDPHISLPIILGKDLSGKPYVVDLAKMPHLLVAGTTGSGKSVAINAMIISLLYRYTPAECRLIMIDPKMLELSAYDGIPHLLTPVVTQPPKAVVALKWAVKEMENRYRLMSNVGVRNISGYNAKITEAIREGKKLERTLQTGFDPETGKPVYEIVPISMEKLPFIVVIVDEMADLMLVAGKDIESSIQRLAQMARAAGIHIIMATQRPSVDVITGVIKANFPSRISFKVTSKIDSRTILGEQGSEQLLGMGDMLYMGNTSKITRIHGPFVADEEVEKVTTYLRTTGIPEYIEAVTEQPEEDTSPKDELGESSDDETLYKKAVQIVRLERKVSTSYVQRCLRIGYNRAANIIDRMEKEGLVSAPGHTGKREILLPKENDF